MKSDSTTIIKNMEFLMKELHKEWDRSGAPKASVFISIYLLHRLIHGAVIYADINVLVIVSEGFSK